MDFGEKKAVFRGGIVNRETGYYLIRNGLYDAAITRFDESIKLEEKAAAAANSQGGMRLVATDASGAPQRDARTLLGRSTAYSKKMKTKEAYDDVKAVFDQDPRNLTTAQQRAFATYLCCEFEKSLVLNTRGAPKRKQPPIFQFGIMQCREVIENCVGTKAGHPLRDMYYVISTLSAKKQQRKLMQKSPKWKKLSSYPTEKRKKNLSFITLNEINKNAMTPITNTNLDIPRQSMESQAKSTESLCQRVVLNVKPIQEHTNNIVKVLTEKYLEKLRDDLEFTKRFVDEESLKDSKVDTNKLAKDLAQNATKMLISLEELLRTRKPFYSIKYHYAKKSKRILMLEEILLTQLQSTTENEVNNLLENLHSHRVNQKTHEAIELACRISTFLQNKSKRELPKKQDYLDFTYDLMSLVILDLFQLEENSSRQEQDKKVKYLLGIHESDEESNGSLTLQIKPIRIQNIKLEQISEQQRKHFKSPNELCYLYYNKAICTISSKTKLDKAKHYCKKCIETADENDISLWPIDAMLVLVYIHVSQRNRNEAKFELFNALERARMVHLNNIIFFIKRAIDIIEQVDFGSESGTKDIEKREQEILKLTKDPKMKEQINYLFKRMSVMPQCRRLSIVPGVKVDDNKLISKKKISISTLPIEKQKIPPKGEIGYLDMLKFINS